MSAVMNFNEEYNQLLREVYYHGVNRPDPNRKGVTRRQIPFYNFFIDLRDSFPAITTKPLYWKGVVGELLWFLSGDTNIKYLLDNNVHIWDKDAYNWYLENILSDSDGHNVSLKDYIDFVESNNKLYDEEIALNKKGDLGRIYGAQWRSWLNLELNNELFDDEYPDIYEHNSIDQISNLIKNLKENPLSSSHIVTAWNPSELNDMALPPCHWSFQVTCEPIKSKCDCSESEAIYCGERVGKCQQYYLDLSFNMRSSDVLLGLPFNIASYALLAHIIAKCVGMVPRYLNYNGTNVHLYDNQLEAAKTQLSRDPLQFEEPNLEISIDSNTLLDHMKGYRMKYLSLDDFKLINYKHDKPLPKVEMLSYNK